MNIEVSDLQAWGSFALVSYIPDPLGAFLQSLRHSLPGQENPRAHITVLPPRPLKAPMESVSHVAKPILGRFEPFPVELRDVKVFPETHIMYLAIGGGSDQLHRLHDALNTGILTHEENFEFSPHLTISGAIPFENLAEVKAEAGRAWEKYNGEKRFQIADVVALWQPPHGSWDDWNRLWDHELGDRGTSAWAGSSS
jgi:2'-5' RNA ligase